jgi:hypothetical protein
MVRHASLFSQLIGLFNRQRFYELVYRHGSERYAKGFISRDHFVAMLFFQIGQAKSLREISSELANSLEKLLHLNAKAAPNKSTLSYANVHRPWQLFQNLFSETSHESQLEALCNISKFRFKNKTLSIVHYDHQKPIRRLVPAGVFQRGQRNENHLERDHKDIEPQDSGCSSTNPQPSRTLPEVSIPLDRCSAATDRLTPFKKIPQKSQNPE